MDNENKIFELMEKMYVELQEVKNEVKDVKNEVQDVKNEVKGVKNQVIIIEQDHGTKLDVLLDGYKQNAEKLNRVEKEVSKHEEVILRRIR